MAAVVAVGLFGTGCGGSDDASSAESEHAVFVKQADAVCQGAQKKQVEELNAHEGDVISTTLAVFRTEAGEIGALHIPSAEKSEVEEMLTLLRKVIAITPKELSKANELLVKAEKISSKQGLKHCLAG